MSWRSVAKARERQRDRETERDRQTDRQVWFGPKCATSTKPTSFKPQSILPQAIDRRHGRDENALADFIAARWRVVRAIVGVWDAHRREEESDEGFDELIHGRVGNARDGERAHCAPRGPVQGYASRQ